MNSDASHQQHEMLTAAEDHKEQRKTGKKKAGKDREKEKSGSGIFKGLGHMFRLATLRLTEFYIQIELKNEATTASSYEFCNDQLKPLITFIQIW